MSIKSIIVKKSKYDADGHDIIWKKVDDLIDVGLVMELEEEEKEEKYKQLEFEFEDDFNLTEDQVFPI